ncbi:MAG: efflux RND transporter periplasmic adaptor subunit [Polyangiales bacterium]
MRVALFMAVFGAAAIGGSACSKEAAKPAAPPPPKVLVEPVRERQVDLSVESVAQVDGYVNADLRARVPGFLKQQLYRDGNWVKTGQVLFTIDPIELEAALSAARGTLARAQAAVELSRANLKRSEALSESGTITKRALDDAIAAHADSEGQLRAAQATVRTNEVNLGYTQVRSPIDGIAGTANVRVGNLVGREGPTLLTTVSQLDPMRVRFPVSERDYLRSAARLKALQSRDLAWAKKQFEKLAKSEPTDGGDPGVELVLADGKTYAHRGVVVAADREIDPSTGTIQLEALFPNPDALLRPGQYARVQQRSPDSGPALVVAQKALLEVQGTFSVAVVKEGNKVELRRVEVGPSSGADRVITKGLTAGERVVIEGVQKVSDGATVAPENPPEAGKAAQLAP